MRLTSTGFTVFLGIAFVLCSGTFSSAGILALHPDAVDDVNGFPARGAAGGNSGPGLAILDVTIEYAVFTAADFTSNFGGEGYVPTGPLVYAYQVFVNDPPSNVTVDTQLVLQATGTTDAAPGSFTANGTGDKAPSSTVFSGNIAQWFFAGGQSIAPGESSYGMAFSSTNVPEFPFTTNQGQAESINGETAGAAVHVPSNTVFVPEPTTLILVTLSLLGISWRRRKRT